MLTKQQKKELVKELTQKANDAKSIIFVDYKGLKVKDIDEIKKSLREAKVEYLVARKTLLEIALKETGVTMDVRGMDGQVAAAFSYEDEVVASKTLDKFAKTNENLKFFGGVLEGKVMSATEVKALAKLPSKPELLGKLVGTLNAPVSGFVNVLAGNMRGLVQVLNAVKEQKA